MCVYIYIYIHIFIYIPPKNIQAAQVRALQKARELEVELRALAKRRAAADRGRREAAAARVLGFLGSGFRV